MKEVRGDIWDYHEQGNWIVITTNGNVKANGEAVMGRGVALQAKKRFPDLPYRLAECIRMAGNQLHQFQDYKILTLPVKENWFEKAVLRLVEQSIEQLVGYVDYYKPGLVYMVRPGCSSGELNWKDVKPILEKYLDDRFVIVEKYPSTILTVEGLPQGPSSKTSSSIQRAFDEEVGGKE